MYPKILTHRTYEIVKIIKQYNPPCDLIITMNIAVTLLKSIATKDTDILYHSCCDTQKLKNIYPKATEHNTHIKLYRTKTHVIISTANLSLSSFLEISVVFERTPELDKIVSTIVNACNKTKLPRELA